MPRVKKPVWEHFDTIGKHKDSHPHVRCKYCPKNFRRAVPQRMQTHLDKCEVAPDDAKSKSQNNTNNIHSDSVSIEEQIVEKVLQILSNSGYYQQNINGYYGADQFL